MRPRVWNGRPGAAAVALIIACLGAAGCAESAGSAASNTAKDSAAAGDLASAADSDPGAADTSAGADNAAAADTDNGADTFASADSASNVDTAAAVDPWSKVFVGADGQKYTVGLELPSPTKLGKNPATLFIQRSSDGSTWTPVTDASVKLTTLMVSMGHGSSGNVSPVGQGDGSYVGTVVFSMPGDWRISFAVTVGGKLQGTVHYDLKI